MARDLDLKPAHFSALIKGRNGLSFQRALRVATSLGLSSSESDYFCLMVHLDRAKTPHLRGMILEKMRALNGQRHVQDLSVDLFSAISNWYHIPILEMTQMAGFKLSPASAAERLGITRLEAEVAIERLVRLELLEQDPKGNYRKVVDNYLFKSATPNAALRSFHEQMLEKAAFSLSQQPPAERYIGSQTFAIDPGQLEEAALVIGECRRKLVDLFKRGKSKTQTYYFGVQLFNLTHKRKGEGK